VLTDAKREAKEAEADKRRVALVAYLEGQARGWLTPERAEAELTADFFAAPWGLAGQCQERSPYWGYVAETEEKYPEGTILAPNNRYARKEAQEAAEAEEAAAAAAAATAKAVEAKVAAGMEQFAAAAEVRQEAAVAARAAQAKSYGHVEGALRTRREAVNMANMVNFLPFHVLDYYGRNNSSHLNVIAVFESSVSFSSLISLFANLFHSLELAVDHVIHRVLRFSLPARSWSRMRQRTANSRKCGKTLK